MNGSPAEEVRLQRLGSKMGTRSGLYFDQDALATGWRLDRRRV